MNNALIQYNNETMEWKRTKRAQPHIRRIVFDVYNFLHPVSPDNLIGGFKRVTLNITLPPLIMRSNKAYNETKRGQHTKKVHAQKTFLMIRTKRRAIAVLYA